MIHEVLSLPWISLSTLVPCCMPTCPKSASGGSSVARQMPVAVFHKRTLLSCEPVASRWPPGEKATATTQELWPSSNDAHCPVAASHSRAVLSRPQLARRAPVRPEGGQGEVHLMRAPCLIDQGKRPS
jgi:hypothetical protein